MKEFEELLDQAEKSIENPDELFGFILIGHDYMPDAQIVELLMLKDVFDAKQTSGQPNSFGSSRAERRAMSKSIRGKQPGSRHSKKTRKKRK